MITEEKIEEIFESIGYGICVEDLAITQDSIEDFVSAAKGYAESRGVDRGTTEDGHAYIIVHSARPRPGLKKDDLVVLDAGDKRYVYAPRSWGLGA